VKLGKSATETLDLLYEDFGEHSLSWTVVFEWHSCFKASQVSVVDEKSSGGPSTSKIKDVETILEITSSTKTVAKESMRKQTLLGSLIEFARRSFCH
jgi:hypothetical protein